MKIGDAVFSSAPCLECCAGRSSGMDLDFNTGRHFLMLFLQAGCAHMSGTSLWSAVQAAQASAGWSECP